MNDQQFNQLMEMIGNAGEGAWPLAVIYLGEGYFKAALLATVVLVIVFVGRGIIRHVTHEETMVKAAYRAAGVDYSSYSRYRTDGEVLAALESRPTGTRESE